MSQLNNAAILKTFEDARDLAATCGFPSARVESFPRGYVVAVPGPQGLGSARFVATTELLPVTL